MSLKSILPYIFKMLDLKILSNLAVEQLSLRKSRFPKPVWQRYGQLSANLLSLDLSSTGQGNMVFVKMPRLRTLVLAENNIQKLHWPFLFTLAKRTPSLTQLDLGSNRLTTLPQQMAKASDEMKTRLGQIDLRLIGNPIHCNCELDWLVEGTQFAKWRDALPCLTLATTSPETGYTVAMCTRTLGSLLSSSTEEIKLACLKPTTPRIAISEGRRLERKSGEGSSGGVSSYAYTSEVLLE